METEYFLDVTGFHHGQTDGVILAVRDDKVVGGLDWQVYGGEVLIAWIEVAEECRRQGIGTGLVKRLKEDFPEEKIDWGMTTPDGTALRASMKVGRSNQ